MWDENVGGVDQIDGTISIDDEFVDLPFNTPVKFKTIGFTRGQLASYILVDCKTMAGIRSFRISLTDGIIWLYVNVDGDLQTIPSNTDSEIIIDTNNNKIYVDDTEYAFDSLLVNDTTNGSVNYFYIESVESITVS